MQGVVRDGDGRRLVGASVFASSAEYKGLMNRHRSRTDEEGRYEIDGIPPGEVTVSAYFDEYERTSQDVEIESGRNELDFTLEKGLQVRGRVVDSAGSPVDGARIDVSMTGSSTRRSFSANPLPETGAFQIPRPVLGHRLSLLATKPGVGVASKEDIFIHREMETIELRLEPGATVLGQISGLTIDDLAKTSIAMGKRSVRYGRGPTVDFEGRFRIEDIQPGSHVLRASVGSKRRRKLIPVEPGDGEIEVELVFGDGATLRGTVLAGDEPVPRVTVSVQGVDVADSMGLTTDAEGVFLADDLLLGRYRIAVTADDLNVVREVDLDGDRDIVVEVPDSSVSGRVVDRDGIGIEGAVVWACRPRRWCGTAGPDSRQTGPDGLFELDGLSTGNYVLKAHKEGFAPGLANIEVALGAADEETIQLRAAQGITLQIARSTAGTPRTLWVSVFDLQGQRRFEKPYPVSASGQVDVEDLPSGRWRLFVSDEQEIGQLTVDVPSKPVEVFLKPGGSVDLRVQNSSASSRYVGELRMVGEPPGFGMNSWRRGQLQLETGRKVLGPLLPGRWVLVLEDSSPIEIEVAAGQMKVVVVD